MQNIGGKMVCELQKTPAPKPVKDCNDIEYNQYYNQIFLRCGEDCDCCFFSCNGGIGYGSDE